MNERMSKCWQDTVVALQALAEYAALTSGNSDRQNLTITVTAADTLTHTFTITAANSLVLQSVQASLLIYLHRFI